MPTKSDDKKVVKAVREAVIAAAKEAETVKQKTAALRNKVGKKWKDSEPNRQRAKKSFDNAAAHVVDFGKSVAQGVREGMTHVNKKSKKR